MDVHENRPADVEMVCAVINLAAPVLGGAYGIDGDAVFHVGWLTKAEGEQLMHFVDPSNRVIIAHPRGMHAPSLDMCASCSTLWSRFKRHSATSECIETGCVAMERRATSSYRRTIHPRTCVTAKGQAGTYHEVLSWLCVSSSNGGADVDHQLDEAVSHSLCADQRGWLVVDGGAPPSCYLH